MKGIGSGVYRGKAGQLTLKPVEARSSEMRVCGPENIRSFCFLRQGLTMQAWLVSDSQTSSEVLGLKARATFTPTKSGF